VPSTKVNLSIKFGKNAAGVTPPDVNSTQTIDGLNSTQATANMLSQASTGSNATLNGPNSINITNSGGSGRNNAPIAMIDGGSNTAGIVVAFDGNVTSALLPENKWVAFFEPGIDSPTVTAAGTLTLVVPGTAPVDVSLSTGTTPSSAAIALGNALTADSFPNVSVDPVADRVSFFLSPSGTPIDTITQFSFDGANLGLGLQLPAEVPEPSAFLILSAGVLCVSYLHYRTLRRTG
jgi:hypothetical protein